MTGTTSFRHSHISAALTAAAFALAAPGCNDSGLNSVVIVTAFVTVNSGDGQTGPVGQPLPLPISVHVADQAGSAIENVAVSWSVMAGGGFVGASMSTTNVNGDAIINWTLGPSVGMNSLTASIPNGANVVINATAAAAAPLLPVAGELRVGGPAFLRGLTP